MWKIAVSLLFAVSLAYATPSAPVPAPTSDTMNAPGYVPIENAQRVIHFDYRRLWYTVDGVVLVCPLDAENAFRDNSCVRGKTDAWVPLLLLKIPGYEIAGVQYVISGSAGYRNLVVFWRKQR